MVFSVAHVDELFHVGMFVVAQTLVLKYFNSLGKSDAIFFMEFIFVENYVNSCF